MNKNKHWLVPDWPAPANVHAATTLRTGGISKEPYLSLNTATHVNDTMELVLQNRKVISDMLNLPTEPVWLDQIHSNRIVKAEKTAVPQQADASYSSDSGVVCTVMTADCLPLLICSKDGEKIAARKEKAPSSPMMVDGTSISDTQDVVIRDRQMLSQDGITGTNSELIASLIKSLINLVLLSSSSIFLAFAGVILIVQLN